MSQPLIHEGLVDSAAALVLTQHDSPYAQIAGEGEWNTEEHLANAREAASKYLVAVFTHAATAVDDDD